MFSSFFILFYTTNVYLDCITYIGQQATTKNGEPAGLKTQHIQ